MSKKADLSRSTRPPEGERVTGIVELTDAAFYKRLQDGIQDERLRSLTRQVYQRLPTCDRQVWR